MAKRMKEKTAARELTKDTRPKAFARHIRISPYKVRSVIALIRGKDYFAASAILDNLPKSASLPVKKALDSAAANAEQKNMMKKDLFVAEIFADQGPTQKRMMPRARGSADRILKRSSHITVILDEKKEIK